MKIVYLHQYFVTPQMSGGTRSYEMARRLVADGHDVHMITSDTKGGARRDEVIDGIRVTWIPAKYSNTMGVLQRVWTFLLFAIKSSGAAAKSEADVIFATSTPLTIAIPAVWAKWRQRIPMVFEVRDLWPEMPIAIGVLTNPILIRIARWMEKLAYTQSSSVIALSPGMKEGVVETGYPEDKVVVVPNSSDLDRFQIDPVLGQEWLAAQSWYRGGPVVLYPGTFGLINNVGYLVEIAQYTREILPNLTMLLVGSGQEKNAIEKKAIDLGLLGQQVVLMDRVPKSEIPTIYSAATVVVSTVGDIPNVENNSANKFFDSLAASRPILINHGGWLADLIEECNCGLRLSRDPEQAAKELVAFVASEGKLFEAGERARTLAEERFSRDRLYILFRDTLQSAENRA